MFKKVLSVLLSAILILSSIICTVTAGGDDNVVLSLDFENYPSGGALNKFVIANTGDAAQGKALYGNFTAADANLSPAAAVMTSASDAKLTKGATYKVSLKYKAINLNSTFAFNLYYTDNANSYVRKKVSGANTNAAVSPYLVRFAHNGTGATARNEWIEASATFTAEYDAYVYLGLWTNAVTEFYIDDFKISKVSAVKVNFNTNGGNAVTSLAGISGDSLPTLPTPTRENASFMGWYTDSSCTNPFTATVYPNEDITLYAKWGEAGVVYQTFENYDATVSGRLANYTLITSNGTDGNAHGGTKAIYRVGENKTFRVALFPNEATAPLVAGNTYELRFFVKIASPITATGTIQLMYSPDKNNAHAQVSGSSMPNICILKKSGEASTNIDASKVGEWQEVVYTFSATHNGFLNLSGWGPNEYYLDDVSLKCLSAANVTITFNTNGGSEVSALKGVSGDALPTLPVPVKTGKVFAGWYSDEALTTVFGDTLFPKDNITLYAKWIDEGVYNQDFEGYIIGGSLASNTLSVYSKKSDEDQFVHGGNKSLYKPAVNSSYFVSPFPYATKKLEVGKGYKLNMWVYVPNKVEKAAEGAWQLTLLDSKDNAFSVGDRKKTNIKYFNSSFKEGEWQNLELIFTASADGFMGLYAYGAFEMYIDDITLVEVDTVTVTFDSCGGNSMDALSGSVGQIVSSVPTPTHPDDMAFAGWFTDKEYTQRFNFKQFPENDVTVYAKWIKKGSFEQTFEGYYYENDTAGGTYSKDVLSLYHATSDNDPLVHSGKTSMRYYQKLVPESKTYGFSIFDPTMGQLEIGEKYYVSYWLKPTEISNTFYHAVYNNSVVDNMFANYNMKGYFTTHTDVIGKTGDVSEYFFGPAGKYKVSEPDENGWIKFTFEATATDKYFSIYLNWDAEVYIDDVVIEPLPTGVVDAEYSKAYCEPLYDEIGYQHPDALNKKSDTSMVYPIEVEKRGDYVFSAALSKNAKDGYIALSFDAEGKEIIEGTRVTAGENLSMRMMMSKEPTIYLVVYNPIGEGMVEKAILCRTAAAKESVNIQKSPYIYYDEDELPELSELMRSPKYQEVFSDAYFESELSDGVDNQSSNDEASPQTGDSSMALVVMIISVTALTAMVVCCFRKRRGFVC